MGDPRVIDKNIQTAKVLNSILDSGFNVIQVGNIAPMGVALYAHGLDLCLDSVQTVQAAGTDSDVSSLVGQSLGELDAQARGSAGYKSHSAG